MADQKPEGCFAHAQALVESSRVGAGTRVWAFTHILPGAVIGRDCNICDHVFIENDVVVGDRVTIKCGVQLWDGLRIEDDVFLGPNATFTNDRYPRSRQHLPRHPETVVKRGASIGANATVLPGLVVGTGAMVGAGAVVTRNVPPNAVVVGNPAHIVRYAVETNRAEAARTSAKDPAATDEGVLVRGVRLLRVPTIKDMRGNLVARQIDAGLPFLPERCFMVYDVPSKELRGEHAHRRCEQLLICVGGSVNVLCDDGERRQEFTLDTPELGLYVGPMVWGTQYRYSRETVLLVLASLPYDADDYIRDYEQFLAERRLWREPG
ncbi:MAG: WxcM-like domain-containing protein [Deltaproteobacteria bacterium]|nr:WxcM-like domain-containing protein [Deltaproteobacteria bacterium]